MFGFTSNSTVNYYIKDENFRSITSGDITSGLSYLTSGRVTSGSATTSVEVAESSPSVISDTGMSLVAKLGVSLGIIMAVGIFVLVSLVVYCVILPKKRKRTESDVTEIELGGKSFILGQMIGRGNFGEVYIGYREGKAYALKKLKSEMMKDFEAEKSVLE